MLRFDTPVLFKRHLMALGFLLTFIPFSGNFLFAHERVLPTIENNIPDSLSFPNEYKIALISVLEKSGRAQKYYLIGVEGASLYAMQYKAFYDQYNSGFAKTNLERISLKNIKYVKVLDIFTFSQKEIDQNSYYNNEVGSHFLKTIGTGFGASALLGLSLDVWISTLVGAGAITFPIITLSASFVGLAYSFIGASLKALMDFTGKFGEFKKHHLLKRDGFSFKYDFIYGKMSFNKRAMKAISYRSLNR